MAYEPDRREVWGYIVWGSVALVIAIPEITAASGKVPWPTISGTVGHLEYLRSWVALIVVGVIVSAAYYSLRPPGMRKSQEAAATKQTRLRRTRGERLTVRRATERELSPAWSLLPGLAAVVAGSVITALLKPHGMFLLGYVLYGLIAVFGIVLPSLLAFLAARDVPFPPLFRTIRFLEGRLHPATVLIAVGLAILLVHLALYPWPDIFHVLQQQPTVHTP